MENDQNSLWNKFKEFMVGNPGTQQNVAQNFNNQANWFDSGGSTSVFDAPVPGTETVGATGGLLGGDFGSMQGWGQMLGGLGDIGSAYMAYKNYGLAKDQFDFTKSATNRNLANQSVVVNDALLSKQNARRAQGLSGGGARVDGSNLNV